MFDKAYIESLIWRFVRVALSAGLTQAILIQPNWANPLMDLRTLAVAFGTGFVTTLFKAIRDYVGNLDVQHPVAQATTQVVQKLPL